MVALWLIYAFGDISRFNLSDFAYNCHVSASAKLTYKTHVNVSLVTRRPHCTLPQANNTLWNEVKDVFTNPYFAPLMASDVSRLPATFISTVEQDVLRDDGVIYAARLRRAGVTVRHRHYITLHGMITYMFLATARGQAADAVEYMLTHV